MSGDRRLEGLDAALDSARRLWQRPDDRRRFLADVGEPVEAATLRVLRSVERVEHDEPCIGDLAEALMVDASTASRLVDQAVSAGYVSRELSASDRRRVILALTPDGERVLARATAVRRERIRRATSTWSDADVEQLTDLLERLLAATSERSGA